MYRLLHPPSSRVASVDGRLDVTPEEPRRETAVGGEIDNNKGYRVIETVGISSPSEMGHAPATVAAEPGSGSSPRITDRRLGQARGHQRMLTSIPMR